MKGGRRRLVENERRAAVGEREATVMIQTGKRERRSGAGGRASKDASTGMAFEFVIPRARADLLRSGRERQYVVEEVLPLRQLPDQIQAFQSAFRSRGPLAVLEHFDSLYSVLSQFKDVDPGLQEKTLDLVVKAVSRHSSDLPGVLADTTLTPSDHLEHLNTLKMNCYLLTQFIEAFEDLNYRQELANMGPTGKVRKLKLKSWEFDWETDRMAAVQVLGQLLQVDVCRLWSIGQVEEEFSRLITCCCYHILENSSIGHAKNKSTREAVAHLLAMMIKRYNHMLGATLDVIQLLQHSEQLAPVLVHVVTIWATEYGLKSIVGEIMREIGRNGAGEPGRESSGARSFAAFLAELAERIPEVMIPNISLIVDLLNGESYALRNAVLSAMGQMVTRVLSGPQLDGPARETRDRFLDALQLHLHDVHAFVRSRALQVLTHVVQEKALPLKRFQAVVTLATGRLCDKSVNVCKYAIQLLGAILANNPFTWKLSIAELNSAYEKELLKLSQLREKQQGQIPALLLEPGEEWAAMQPEVLSTIHDELEGEEASESEREAIAPGDTASTVCCRVHHLLKGAKYKRAVQLTLDARERYPDTAPFAVEDLDESGESPRVARLLRTMAACFEDTEEAGAELQAPREQPDEGVPQPSGPDEGVPQPSELDKQEVLVQYLREGLTFTGKIEGAIEIVVKFLSSKNPSVVQEAIQFFLTISEFGISQALVGMREMLPLVWSKEAGVKEAVAACVPENAIFHYGGIENKSKDVIEGVGETTSRILCAVLGSPYLRNDVNASRPGMSGLSYEESCLIVHHYSRLDVAALQSLDLFRWLWDRFALSIACLGKDWIGQAFEMFVLGRSLSVPLAPHSEGCELLSFGMAEQAIWDPCPTPAPVSNLESGAEMACPLTT
ncbi:condensin complex subunit 1 [Heterodontus francisci]|uniref:condensin complex subunit 1 n=1 Tax=Heterodontus francisci TaxID=7792 RepID=UPI00355B1EA9